MDRLSHWRRRFLLVLDRIAALPLLRRALSLALSSNEPSQSGHPLGAPVEHQCSFVDHDARSIRVRRIVATCETRIVKD